MKPRVTIYGNPECCLCDQALEVLEEVRKRTPFEIEKRDISGDADLIERYGLDIPVILIDGQVAFKHRIDKDRLIALLKGR
ncbi:glutaredoxin family protein [Chlorobaculum thiosulfatiphilum]|uniref:Glutaredoxin family protein n=1 Tax=Chlorobaculum thiosulfatiphilum TaxID=115852 RepID=A0A5C4S6Y3_CHLTI|nr:glutaredoxin family protein [Chlorobaculum thiosulfatiphilum]TNJ39085.1 glutaredoxin family protein [Chlorobaculum thiosulfatiphilum]